MILAAAGVPSWTVGSSLSCGLLPANEARAPTGSTNATSAPNGTGSSASASSNPLPIPHLPMRQSETAAVSTRRLVLTAAEQRFVAYPVGRSG